MPGAANAPLLKRLFLPQGELAQFYDAPNPIQYIAYIELKVGTLRGNHYHKQKFEWIYLISGEFLLRAEDVVTHQRESLTVRGGDLVNIRTGVAHALDIVKAGQAIEFSPARFDATDTYRYIVP